MTAQGGHPLRDYVGVRYDVKGGAPDDFTGLATLVASEPWTWTGSDLVSSPKQGSFVLQLSNEEIIKIEEALHAFKKLELDGDEVNRDNFPLPALQERLEDAAIDIHQRCGFVVIRGLDPGRYSAEDNLIIFLGIADYIGNVRGMQDRKGNMISHITDSKHWRVSHALRHGIHTNTGLPFHNDMGADILALQVRQCAGKGGNTYLASASKLFCELAKTDPEAVKALFKPDWPIQLSGKASRHVLAPLMQYHKGKFMISVDPGRLGQHPATSATARTPSAVPALTPMQKQALAALSATATRHRLPLNPQTGDIVFVNNWALLHARDSYVDDADRDGDGDGDGDGSRRHLLRLWLRSSRLGWAVPPAMSVPWEAAFGIGGNNKKGRRGSGPGLYPVMPAPDYKVPKYTSGSAAFAIEDSDTSGEDD